MYFLREPFQALPTMSISLVTLAAVFFVWPNLFSSTPTASPILVWDVLLGAPISSRPIMETEVGVDGSDLFGVMAALMAPVASAYVLVLAVAAGEVCVGAILIWAGVSTTAVALYSKKRICGNLLMRTILAYPGVRKKLPLLLC